MLRALLFVGVWVASLGALAAESGGVFGLGTKPCREVTEMSADPNARKIIASWMEGYLSGLNYEHVKASKKYLDAGSLTPEAQFEIALSSARPIPPGHSPTR
jgi:hypothetical protein